MAWVTNLMLMMSIWKIWRSGRRLETKGKKRKLFVFCQNLWIEYTIA